MANPKACVGAEANGKLVGFLFGHIKGGEFGNFLFNIFDQRHNLGMQENFSWLPKGKAC